MEAVARFAEYRVPVVNKQLSYLLFACIVTVGSFTMIATKTAEPAVMVPLISIVVGHFFGSQGNKDKDNGKATNGGG